jgi:beta-phosphoglucomutase-like phosphatase (HAD superfamily)
LGEQKIVIFDLDGTLYQTETVSVAATKHAFKELNLKIPDEKLILKHFGETTEDYCKNLYPEGSLNKRHELAKQIRKKEKK